MLEVDELDTNPFFRALQTQPFLSYFLWAQDKCGLVCIPHSRSLRGLELNREFVDKHTFRPSPLFKDHYITRDGKRPLSVSIEEDNVVTKEGYPDKRNVKILSEELGYNKRSETFRILIIDKPLVGNPEIKVEQDGFFFDSPSILNYSESHSFLSCYPGGSQVLATLDKEILLFCNNYMILPEFLDDATEKLHGIWTAAVKGFLACVGDKMCGSEKLLKSRIQLAVESYLLGSVNSKLFPKICEHCSPDDVSLETKCRQLQGLTLCQLGVPPSVQCDLTPACEKLASLDACCCTLEKTIRVKEVLDSITESVKSSCKQKNSSSDDGFLTSDQYLPLLVSVIVNQKSNHISSNVYYMEKLQFYVRPYDSLSFSLVTFKAAYSYIETLNVQLLLPPKTSPPEKEKEVLRSHHSVDGSSSSSSPFSSSSSPFSSSSALSPQCLKLERELDQITRMIQTPTNEFDEASHVRRMNRGFSTSAVEGSDRNRAMRKASNPLLGEFLLALKEDTRQISFGKQS